MSTPYNMTPMANSTRPPRITRGSAAISRTLSGLGGDDLFPQAAVLFLVLRPQLLLCQVDERRVVGLVDRHAMRLKLLLGGGQRVDVLRHLADNALRLTAGVEKHLLLVRRQVVEHLQVHGDQR